MLFNSIAFLIYFPIITFLYFVLPYKFRWMLLLAASCYFYMAFIPYYILILGFTIVVDYFAGIYIEKAKDKRQRKLLLIISIIANIGTLVFFKYFNFLNANVSALLDVLSIENPVSFLNIILPIGLSFHTFQALSYTIEVYRGRYPAERNFGIYALYVMFYPQLVAGPIERPQHVLPQFHVNNNFDALKVSSGLRLMMWGFFKKIVIADRLAVAVNTVYSSPFKHDSLAMIIATLFFAIQIYCDFSGYTDIARGAARVMGYELMLNFRSPYFSSSVTEFWQRWHISLSSWFRDYLYIPLGGNRVAIPRWYLNIFIVFLVSGLWHGANWTFIVWGALHGLVVVSETLLSRINRRSNKPKRNNAILRYIRILFTFYIVSLIWVFFRANNINEGFYIIKKMIFDLSLADLNFTLNSLTRSIGLNNSEFAIAIGSIVFLFVFEMLHLQFNLVSVLSRFNFLVRVGIYGAFILSIILFGNLNGLEQFIYFQF